MATLRPQATDAPVLSLPRPAGVRQRGSGTSMGGGVQGASLSELMRLAEFQAQPERERARAERAKEQQELSIRGQQSTIRLRDQLSRERMQEQNRLSLERYETQQKVSQESQALQQKYSTSLNSIQAFHTLMKEKFSAMPEEQATEDMALLVQNSPELQEAFSTVPEARIFVNPEFYLTQEEEQAAMIERAMGEAEARAAAETAYWEGAKGTLAEMREMEAEAAAKGRAKADLYTVTQDETGRYVPQRTEDGEGMISPVSSQVAQNYANQLNNDLMSREKERIEMLDKTRKQELRNAEFLGKRQVLTQMADVASAMNIDELPTGKIQDEVRKQVGLSKTELEKFTQQMYEQPEYRGMNGLPVMKKDGTLISGPEAKKYMNKTRDELNALINKDPNKVTAEEREEVEKLWRTMLKLDSPEIFEYMGQWDRKLKKNRGWFGWDWPKKDVPMLFDYNQEYITGVKK